MYKCVLYFIFLAKDQTDINKVKKGAWVWDALSLQHQPKKWPITYQSLCLLKEKSIASDLTAQNKCIPYKIHCAVTLAHPFHLEKSKKKRKRALWVVQFLFLILNVFLFCFLQKLVSCVRRRPDVSVVKVNAYWNDQKKNQHGTSNHCTRWECYFIEHIIGIYRYFMNRFFSDG